MNKWIGTAVNVSDLSDLSDLSDVSGLSEQL
jgi:hypothetical protein